MLTETVIASATHGGEWCTVDLSAYRVPAPDAGFFVAMEWLPSYCAVSEQQICGQLLRPTFEFKEHRTWSYVLGKGWHLVILTNNDAPFNAMMKAEVEYYK